MPVTVAVPAGASLVRLRVLTTANKALFSTFKKVKGGTKVKMTIRSSKLRKKLRVGQALRARGPRRNGEEPPRQADAQGDPHALALRGRGI